MDASRESIVTALLAEYETLRAESLNSIGHRISILNFTFGATAVLVGAVLAGPIPAGLGVMLNLIVLPQIAKAALLVWLGEYARSQRAGRGVATIEARLNRVLGADLMTWETSLQTGSTHMGYPYVATVALLVGTGYAAELAGLYSLAELIGVRTPASLCALVITTVGVVAWEIAFLRFFRTRWTRARRS